MGRSMGSRQHVLTAPRTNESTSPLATTITPSPLARAFSCASARGAFAARTLPAASVSLYNAQDQACGCFDRTRAKGPPDILSRGFEMATERPTSCGDGPPRGRQVRRFRTDGVAGTGVTMDAHAYCLSLNGRVVVDYGCFECRIGRRRVQQGLNKCQLITVPNDLLSPLTALAIKRSITLTPRWCAAFSIKALSAGRILASVRSDLAHVEDLLRLLPLPLCLSKELRYTRPYPLWRRVRMKKKTTWSPTFCRALPSVYQD